MTLSLSNYKYRRDLQMNYREIIKGLERGILLMRQPHLTERQVLERLERFKNFNYKNLSDDEIFWILTYVMFFNIGKKASMIEKKLPLLKPYLYGYRRVANLTDSELNEIIERVGFGLQIYRCKELANRYCKIVDEYGSFSEYLNKAFGIVDTNCSLSQLNQLYNDLMVRFKGTGIGETSRWHFLTELGFYSLKPDSVIKRIFYRLGLIDNEDDNIAAIEVGRSISKSLNLPIRYIDILFVKFGQEGSSDLLGTTDGICLSTRPKCDICPLASICRYNNEIIPEKNSFQKQQSEISLYFAEKKEKTVTNANTDEKYYTPDEYINSNYFKRYSAQCQNLIKHLFNKLIEKNADFYIKKRKNNDFILVPSTRIHAKTNKNIATVWTYASNIRIRVMPDEPKGYYTTSQIDEVIDTIYRKYTEIR